MALPFPRIRPTLEILEGRECPAVAATFNAGVLTVVGDDGPNRVAVFAPGTGAVEVVGDGQRFEFEDVQSIQIATGNGNDRVDVYDFRPAWPSKVDGPAKLAVHLDLGAGSDYVLTRVHHRDEVDLDIASADGGDVVHIGLLVPAVQKVRAAAGRIHLDLGAGGNVVSVGARNYDDVDLAVKTSIAPGTIGPVRADRFVLDLDRGSPLQQPRMLARQRAVFDLSDADDRLTLRTNGYSDVTTQLATAGGDDQVLVRHRAFPIVEQSTVVLDAGLGTGNDRLHSHLAGYAVGKVRMDFGAGTDHGNVQLGTWILDATVPTAIDVAADLGAGSDSLHLAARGYQEVQAKLNAGPADDGPDRLAATFVLPGPEALRRRQMVTLLSMDLARVAGVGYAVGNVTLQGQECLVFFQGGIPAD